MLLIAARELLQITHESSFSLMKRKSFVSLHVGSLGQPSKRNIQEADSGKRPESLEPVSSGYRTASVAGQGKEEDVSTLRLSPQLLLQQPVDQGIFRIHQCTQCFERVASLHKPRLFLPVPSPLHLLCTPNRTPNPEVYHAAGWRNHRIQTGTLWDHVGPSNATKASSSSLFRSRNCTWACCFED